MADKLVAEFIRDWIHNQQLRENVLHKELTEMKSYGLDDDQIAMLRTLELPKIGQLIVEELGLDLEDLREAIYGTPFPSPTGAAGVAAYQEGVTHIRRVVPAIVPANQATTVVVMGQGFKSTPPQVAVQFVTGPPPGVTVAGNVTAISCDIDVWQRVHVDVTLTQTGDWLVRAHNDDEANTGPGGGPLWSQPPGELHAI